MEPREFLAIAMFVLFIALIMTGFPVGWVLGGLAVFFTALAIVFEQDLGIYTGVDWAYTSLTVERIWDLTVSYTHLTLPTKA